MTERDVLIAVRLELGKHRAGCWWRNNCGVADLHGNTVRYGVGNPGGADLIGVYRGLFVAIEVKSPDGRIREEQRRFQRLVESKGGRYYVVRSSEDARGVIDDLERYCNAADQLRARDSPVTDGLGQVP